MAKLDKRNIILVMPRSDAASRGFQHNSAWELKGAGLRVKRGVAITGHVS